MLRLSPSSSHQELLGTSELVRHSRGLQIILCHCVTSGGGGQGVIYRSTDTVCCLLHRGIVASCRLRRAAPMLVLLGLGAGQAERCVCTDGTAVGISCTWLSLFSPRETILISPGSLSSSLKCTLQIFEFVVTEVIEKFACLTQTNCTHCLRVALSFIGKPWTLCPVWVEFLHPAQTQ